MSSIEIITSREKRRYWGRSEKRRWVAALEEPGANASEVARAAGVSTSLLYRWRQQLAASCAVPAFVPVTVATVAVKPTGEAEHSTISIAFGANVRMTIEGVPDAQTLSTAISALKAAPDRR
jgi:transposase-like protein